MAKIIPAQEAGLEGVGRVRVSSSRARRGKILAVEHPIFGWLPYRQWAILRLVPEDRILPAVIVGVSTFSIAKLMMGAVGSILEAPFQEGLVGDILRNLPLFGPGFLLIQPALPLIQQQLGDPKDILEKHPLPFYIATMAAGLTLAGLDPGMALRAFAELLDAITPLT